VIDAAEDTARIEHARPTRMIDVASFALSAHSLRSSGSRKAGAPPFVGRNGLLWLVAAATLAALAFGLVQLRETDAPQPTADANTREALVRAPIPPLPSPRVEVAPVPKAPEADSASAAAKEKSASAERAKPKRAPKAKRPAAAPPPEDAGWVIRR
jgi:hypothetical protein